MSNIEYKPSQAQMIDPVPEKVGYVQIDEVNLTDRWLIVSRANGGSLPTGGFSLTNAGLGLLAASSDS